MLRNIGYVPAAAGIHGVDRVVVGLTGLADRAGEERDVAVDRACVRKAVNRWVARVANIIVINHDNLLAVRCQRVVLGISEPVGRPIVARDVVLRQDEVRVS